MGDPGFVERVGVNHLGVVATPDSRKFVGQNERIRDLRPDGSTNNLCMLLLAPRCSHSRAIRTPTTTGREVCMVNMKMMMKKTVNQVMMMTLMTKRTMMMIMKTQVMPIITTEINY